LGTAGANNLQGLAGNDALNGGAGADNLYGGTGADALDGGADFDYAYYDAAAAGVTVDLSGVVAGTGDALGDTFVAMEGVIGSAFADTIYGNAAANNLQGLAGNDTLNGGAGTDNLYGGIGADVLNGGAAFDNARYDLAAAAVTVDLSGVVAGTGEAAGDTFISIEGVLGSAFADTLSGDGGANTVNGRAGNDTLDGRAGNDQVLGEAGNDVLRGGTGADTLTGGAGDDDFVYGATADSNETAGLDTIADMEAGDQLNLSALLLATNKTVILNKGSAAYLGSTVDFFNDAGTDRAVAVQTNGATTRVYADSNGDGNYTLGTDLAIQFTGNVLANLTSTSDYIL
jgi:serralysin